MILPSSTIEPAIWPTFGMKKTCRTCGATGRDLALDAAEQAAHRLLQRVDGLVDDVEDLDGHVVLLGQLA